MKATNGYTRCMPWCVPLLLGGLAVGCSGSRAPILGIGDIVELAPTVTAVTPADLATQVPVNTSTIVVAFSEPMASITGADFTVTAGAPASNPSGTVALDLAGRFATFTVATPVAPATSLAANTVYTGTVTGLKSVATGLPLMNPYIWSFTTGSTADLTRPRVAASVPATTVPGPTNGVPVNADISAVFSSSLNPATITAASFTVTTAAPGVNPIGTVRYLVGSRTAVFAPATALAANTTYTATVTTVAADLQGNALAGNQAPLPAASNYVWTFTTGAATSSLTPMITGEFPGDQATGIADNASISATFNLAMDMDAAVFTVERSSTPAGPALPGAVTYDPLSNTATFTPAGQLSDDTEYTATITGAKDLAGQALTSGTVPNPWSFTTGSAVVASAAINLGSASSYGIMATSAITSTGLTIINGDVSLTPGSSMTGFPPGIVNGSIHIGDGVAAQANTDLLTAFNTAKALPPGTTVAAGADLGAVYSTGMAPGTYTSGSTMLVSTPLTLDAGGNANAVWVFQIGSSLTTSASILLANGAQSRNVFWVPSQDATVGTGTTFRGTILAGRNATCVTGSTIDGRILAGATSNGTIALQSNVINVSGQ